MTKVYGSEAKDDPMAQAVERLAREASSAHVEWATRALDTFERITVAEAVRDCLTVDEGLMSLPTPDIDTDAVIAAVDRVLFARRRKR